jgi:hypothetical protein
VDRRKEATIRFPGEHIRDSPINARSLISQVMAANPKAALTLGPAPAPKLQDLIDS